MKPAAPDILQLSPGTAAAAPSRARDFYELIKPRMNLLVVATTAIGFFLAKAGSTNWTVLINTIVGTALCAACAAVLNQLIERDQDAKMQRTRNRPLPAGRVRRIEALTLGTGCGLVGLLSLAITVNLLTALLGLVTIVWYLGLYTPAKRLTTLNTVIGAIPGAIPPMMGFTAAQGALSPAALSVFTILFFWQMPHFLAIAVMYRNDYRLGGFRMLPSVEQDPRLPITGRMIVLYALALLPASLLPVQLGVAGPAYFSVALMLGLAFLSFAISAAASASRIDAKKLFFASIVYLPLLLTAMMLDRV